MKLLVGLGNYGTQYALTRHNAGFLALDSFVEHIAEELGTVTSGWTFEKKMRADVMSMTLKNEKLLLTKPRTFMNSSGDAVLALVNFYHIPLEDIVVLYDDVDLPLGTIRFRSKGSSAGHKGMQSIIERLGTNKIARLRIGISYEGRAIPTDSFVLQRFNQEEQDALKKVFDKITETIKGKYFS